MGLYLNPPEGTKEQFLEKFGFTVPMQHEFVNPKKSDGVMVCLIDSCNFTAALIVINKFEYGRVQNIADKRKKSMYIVPKSDLKKIGAIK